MEKYTINKGGKKLGNFYMDDLGYKNIHILDATKIEIEGQELDKFNMVCRFTPGSVFAIRKNSCIIYENIKEAQKTINDVIASIKKDYRYNEYIKNKMIKYVQSFKIVKPLKSVSLIFVYKLGRQWLMDILFVAVGYVGVLQFPTVS